MFTRSKPTEFSTCFLFTNSSIEQAGNSGAVGVTTGAIWRFVDGFAAWIYYAAPKNRGEPAWRRGQLSDRQGWRR
jgi:hypothetical protein